VEAEWAPALLRLRTQRQKMPCASTRARATVSRVPVVGEKRLTSLAGPLTGRPSVSRPCDQRELGKTVARAEFPPYRGPTRTASSSTAEIHATRASAAPPRRCRVKRVAFCAGSYAASAAAGSSHARDALHQARDGRRGGARESRFRRSRIAEIRVDVDVGTRSSTEWGRRSATRPAARVTGRAARSRRARARLRRARADRFGDNHRDRLADESRFVAGRASGARRRSPSVAVCGDVAAAHRQRPVRNGFQAVLREIRAGQYRQHAAERVASAASFADPSVGVRQRTMTAWACAGDRVVAVAAVAGDEPRVFCGDRRAMPQRAEKFGSGTAGQSLSVLNAGIMPQP